MTIALVTGSAGLVGAEASAFFSLQGMGVVGIDNDMRAQYFGDSSSNRSNLERLQAELPRYTHHSFDVRERNRLESIFKRHGSEVSLILHAAAQPSHDWAADHPEVDFSVNAVGTLNLLELARTYCPDAVFIFVSTNKVYGDSPNRLPVVEQESRWEVDPDHSYSAHGIDETMSIDASMHSLFGVSKTAADLLVQEYGRYFGMRTACFRAGCITGPHHAGAKLHGFLAYLVQCAVERRPYTVYGYKGKQVRDNIHSSDLVRAFWSFYCSPRSAEVYNIGGGRRSSCSVREAITFCEEATSRQFDVEFSEQNRRGDHIWWISDTRKFQSHYPDWSQQYGTEQLLREMVDSARERQVSR